MKKLLLSTALCVATFMTAQMDFSSTRFGITGGATYSRISHAHNPSGALFSGYGGVLALIPVDNNDQFYLQPGIEYLGAGESGKDKEKKGMAGYNAKYANYYISVPVYFKGYFSEAESEFFAMAGPRFNFLLNQKITGDAPQKYTIEGQDFVDTNGSVYNVNGKAASFNLALGVGIGFSYKRKLEITGKYDFGISDTYKGLKREFGDDPNIQKSKSEHVVSIGLSYIFE